MTSAKVHPWSEVKGDFNRGLVLGNGASIAFDPRFSYQSLRAKAKELGLLTADVQRVFEHLHTEDFELVLRILWHASKVNQALAIPDHRTVEAYERVRDALIEVVRATHVPYEAVSDRLPAAANFMSHFSTVASLNYDLLVYWSLLVGNEDAPNRFKDCFLEGKFQRDWRWFRKPYRAQPKATLVFYPHGNLALVADLGGAEFKIQANEGTALLDTVFTRWRTGDTSPVFVSEGTSKQKRVAIRRSPYLSTVYEDLLPHLGQSVVILGWSMGDADDHLLDAICKGGDVERFALAVRPGDPSLDEFTAIVHRKLTDRRGRNTFEVTLFDRSSAGCWVSP